MKVDGDLIIADVFDPFHLSYYYYRGLYYKSSVGCFLKTAQQEGFLAMYKGFFPAWIRMG